YFNSLFVERRHEKAGIAAAKSGDKDVPVIFLLVRGRDHDERSEPEVDVLVDRHPLSDYPLKVVVLDRRKTDPHQPTFKFRGRREVTEDLGDLVPDLLLGRGRLRHAL